ADFGDVNAGNQQARDDEDGDRAEAVGDPAQPPILGAGNDGLSRRRLSTQFGFKIRHGFGLRWWLGYRCGRLCRFRWGRRRLPLRQPSLWRLAALALGFRPALPPRRLSY